MKSLTEMVWHNLVTGKGKVIRLTDFKQLLASVPNVEEELASVPLEFLVPQSLSLASGGGPGLHLFEFINSQTPSKHHKSLHVTAKMICTYLTEHVDRLTQELIFDAVRLDDLTDESYISPSPLNCHPSPPGYLR